MTYEEAKNKVAKKANCTNLFDPSGPLDVYYKEAAELYASRMAEGFGKWIEDNCEVSDGTLLKNNQIRSPKSLLEEYLETILFEEYLKTLPK